jgi:ABC-type glycerol-3-phosphate transport system substrate-binding protein
VTPRKQEGGPAPAGASDAKATPAPPSRRVLLAVALALLAAGFTIAMIALFRRPGYVVLVRMDVTEESWFRTHIEEFAQQHRVRLTTQAYRTTDELERLLAAEHLARKPRIVLVQTPQDMLSPLVEGGIMRPLTDVVGAQRLDRTFAQFVPEAVTPAHLNSKPYYFPGTLTAPLLFYSRARVAEAAEHWESVRDRVDGWLKQANGHGLPAGYSFEANPNEWDSYDLAVAAAYWASKPFDGFQTPRVAHRARREPGTAMDLAGMVYRMGGVNENLLALDGPPLWDAFAWESFLLEHGLYHPAMIRESWDAGDLHTAIAQGQLFLCLLDQPDLFLLHGTGASGSDGLLRNAADMGVSRVPRGASLEQTRGTPSRAGNPYSVRSGTWWGIPVSSPDAPLGLNLAEHVTSVSFQTEASRAFGHFPTRRQLAQSLDELFREDWMYDVARISRRQIFDLGRALPLSPRWRKLQAVLVASWYDVCVSRKLQGTRELARGLEPYVNSLNSLTAPRAGADPDSGVTRSAVPAGRR